MRSDLGAVRHGCTVCLSLLLGTRVEAKSEAGCSNGGYSPVDRWSGLWDSSHSGGRSTVQKHGPEDSVDTN